MAGGAAAGAGLGIMGGILGGIGDIIAANEYERPSVPDPGYNERRLRQMGQNALRAGGQQLYSATNLYNSMTPALLGMIPGVLVSEDPNATASSLQSYQDALKAYQDRQGAQSQLDALKAQRKGARGKAAKKAMRPQIREAKQKVRGMPSVDVLERNVANAASSPPAMRFGVGGTTGMPAASGASLGEVLGRLAAEREAG